MPAYLWIALASLTAGAASPTPSLEPGSHLTWRGKVFASGESNDPLKSFELAVLAPSAEGDDRPLLWTTEEEGRPSLSWAYRFGRWNGRSADSSRPGLLCNHSLGASMIALPWLLPSAPGELKPGLTWNESGVDYTVEGEQSRLNRPAWKVHGRSRFGVGHELWIDKETGLLLAAEQQVVLGQGERFSLTMELASAERLDEAAVTAAEGQFQHWLALQNKLELKAAEAETIWSSSQMGLLAKELPSPEDAAVFAPLAAIAKAAQEDVRQQKNQTGAVGALAKKVLGQQTPEFSFSTLDGEMLTSQDLGESVTVLHFWTYRDSPLSEPYGQVGYIDYLHRKRKDAGVKVFGVAVDERFDDPEARRSALASVKRFRAFMNLDYPLLIDSGDQIEKFGDPRVAGARLPLVIVIDSRGKVIHYRSGLYDVDRDRGLVELDQVVSGEK